MITAHILGTILGAIVKMVNKTIQSIQSTQYNEKSKQKFLQTFIFYIVHIDLQDVLIFYQSLCIPFHIQPLLAQKNNNCYFVVVKINTGGILKGIFISFGKNFIY